MISIESWHEDILKEKSLLAVYKKSLEIQTPPFNRKVRFYGYPAIAIIGIIAFLNMDAASTKSSIDSINSSIISISASVIGFLVAGITIFTSLSDKSILIELAKTPYKETDISTFKYLFYNFLSIFVIYIGSLVISISIQLFSSMGIKLPPVEPGGTILHISAIINSFVLPAQLIILSEMILKLKSFIWSIYATFISMLMISEFLEKEREL